MVPVDDAVTLVVGIDSPGGPFLPKFSLIINGVTKFIFSRATIFPNEYNGQFTFLWNSSGLGSILTLPRQKC